MDQFDKIKENYTLLNERIETTKTYQNIWKNSLKKIIVEQFQSIVDNICYTWIVAENNERSNMESVILSIPAAPTGITEKYANGGRHFIKYGGYLLFSQTTNGRIVVVIVYPYVEELTSRKSPQVIGFYNPDDINAEFINERVNDFILEMFDWELNKDPDNEKSEEFEEEKAEYIQQYEPIGFKLKGLNSSDIDI